MALPATTVVEVRTTGDDTFGGGFDSASGGTDRSQQTSAQVVIDNSVITATCTTTVITFTGNTYTVLAGDKGNIVNMISGTSLTPGRYAISSVSAGLNGTWTLDHSTGMGGANVTSAKMGGCLLSPGLASGFIVNGNIVYIQNVGADGASVYSVTSASGGVAAGTISSAVNAYFQGFTGTRSLGNTDARPTIQLNVATATMFTLGSGTGVIQNVIFDANNQTSSKFAGSGTAINCVLKNNSGTTPVQSGTSQYIGCSATANAVTPFVGSCYGCEAYANTAVGFTISNGLCICCISSGNTGASTDGFAMSTASLFANCTAVSNGRDGFRGTSALSATAINCHAESNSGFGFDLTNNTKTLINCSHYNNTSGGVNTSNTESVVGTIAVTVGSVFTNAAGNVFQLNNSNNQGQLLKAASYQGTFPRGLTKNYLDIGAAQSAALGIIMFMMSQPVNHFFNWIVSA